MDIEEEMQSSAPADSNIKAEDSITYWNSISADVNGMLGGYPQISRIDLQGSKNFISKISRLNAPRTTRSTSKSGQYHGPGSSPIQKNTSTSTRKLALGVDCGAGIGRVTEGCLSHVCEKVDVVEPVEKFAEVLAQGTLKQEGKVGDIYVVGLESWSPPSDKKYDLIWNQWCLGHLTDAQLVQYLKTAKTALVEGSGWIGVKENMSTRDAGDDIFDELDSSVTRHDLKFRWIFEEAGLNVVKAELQTGFPRGLGLYPVRMYALRPK